MNTTKLNDRVNAIEAEIKLLKKAAAKKPDFSIDDLNWKKIGPSVKKVRLKLYKKVYG